MISVNEAKRLIKSETVCRRDKMFFISFALHMNADDIHKFLTDVALFSQVQYLQSNKQFIGHFYHETIPEIFKHFAYKVN